MLSLCVFFFKQKTAYEMRISDWSSDVCSSDLLQELRIAALKAIDKFDPSRGTRLATVMDFHLNGAYWDYVRTNRRIMVVPQSVVLKKIEIKQIGRASCRERVCKYV